MTGLTETGYGRHEGDARRDAEHKLKGKCEIHHNNRTPKITVTEQVEGYFEQIRVDDNVVEHAGGKKITKTGQHLQVGTYVDDLDGHRLSEVMTRDEQQTTTTHANEDGSAMATSTLEGDREVAGVTGELTLHQYAKHHSKIMSHDIQESNGYQKKETILSSGLFQVENVVNKHIESTQQLPEGKMVPDDAGWQRKPGAPAAELLLTHVEKEAVVGHFTATHASATSGQKASAKEAEAAMLDLLEMRLEDAKTDLVAEKHVKTVTDTITAGADASNTIDIYTRNDGNGGHQTRLIRQINDITTSATALDTEMDTVASVPSETVMQRRVSGLEVHKHAPQEQSKSHSFLLFNKESTQVTDTSTFQTDISMGSKPSGDSELPGATGQADTTDQHPSVEHGINDHTSRIHRRLVCTKTTGGFFTNTQTITENEEFFNKNGETERAESKETSQVSFSAGSARALGTIGSTIGGVLVKQMEGKQTTSEELQDSTISVGNSFVQVCTLVLMHIPRVGFCSRVWHGAWLSRMTF